LVASRSKPGGLVDKLNAAVFQAGKCLGKIRDPVGDVVESRAVAGEKPPDGGVGCQRLQEFQGADELNPDSLAFQDLGGGTRAARQELEHGTSLLKGGNGHGDVVQRIREHVSVPG
jgi:hypothetical protein